MNSHSSLGSQQYIPQKNSGGSAPIFFQPKLTINQPGDVYEQEADAVAANIMRAPSANGKSTFFAPGTISSVQRKCSGCKAEEEKKLHRKENGGSTAKGGPSVENYVQGLGTSGKPLPESSRKFFEPRFNRDFGDVKIHNDAPANQSASALNARAYTQGNNIVFGANQYSPESDAGKELLAHELTHVVQQQPAIRRKAIFPDATCKDVKDNIEASFPIAANWVQEAVSRLTDPKDVAGALQTHFKIDPAKPEHQADLQFVIAVFKNMAAILSGDIGNYCDTPGSQGCVLPDGRTFAAYAYAGAPQTGIHFCMDAAGTGFLRRAYLTEVLVHEVAHLADTQSTDHAYRQDGAKYTRLTREKAIHNGDCFAQFARQIFMGQVDPAIGIIPQVAAGTLLSGGRPQYVIRAGYDIRSQTGLEVFDLIGGFRIFVSLDGSTVKSVGGVLDAGVLTRSPKTHLFADVRLGAFVTGSPGSKDAGIAAGITPSVLLGWADKGFNTGLQVQPLFDFVKGNNALIVVGTFSYTF